MPTSPLHSRFLLTFSFCMMCACCHIHSEFMCATAPLYQENTALVNVLNYTNKSIFRLRYPQQYISMCFLIFFLSYSFKFMHEQVRVVLYKPFELWCGQMIALSDEMWANPWRLVNQWELWGINYIAIFVCLSEF